MFAPMNITAVNRLLRAAFPNETLRRQNNFAVQEPTVTKTYAIGTFTIPWTQLQCLVQQCERDAEPQRSRFIFLGDYIDRGYDSRGPSSSCYRYRNGRRTTLYFSASVTS